jgi:hypothetical protein
MAYFKQLTGSKLPKPVAKKFKVGDNKFEYGVIYKIKTDKGYFTLRNTSLASSKVKSSSLYQTPLCIQ